MNTTQVLITAASAGLVALISGMVAWLIARRTTTGKIDLEITSSAKGLVLVDTVGGARFRVQVTSGALVATAL
jgi:hypothetical protein